MTIGIRTSNHEDREFLSTMLYEAIFWRESKDKPTYEESQKLEFVQAAQKDWGDRSGDEAVIALDGSMQVGAAWYRYWKVEHNTRGYISDAIPVIAIGIHHMYRNKGIGKRLLEQLVRQANEQGVEKVSLCVSKDNYAKRLYVSSGFEPYEDIGDSLIMIRSTHWL